MGSVQLCCRVRGHSRWCVSPCWSFTESVYFHGAPAGTAAKELGCVVPLLHGLVLEADLPAKIWSGPEQGRNLRVLALQDPGAHWVRVAVRRQQAVVASAQVATAAATCPALAAAIQELTAPAEPQAAAALAAAAGQLFQ